MTKFVDIKPSSLSISDFYENDNAGKYNYTPGCQRESNVWGDDTKSFLIDSILKNYPLPPIFLRPKTNNENGKTIYDVIDGKQRLETIKDFINNNVRIPDDFSDDDFFGENQENAKKISGLSFSEVLARKEEFQEYIRQFWTYTLNISVVYEDDDELVDSLFDRLNRNGEPLNSQELRKSQYNQTKLLEIINSIANSDFWKSKLPRKKRMQDKEFISILFFTIQAKEIIDTSRNKLNELYEKNKNIVDFSEVIEAIDEIENIINSFNLIYSTKLLSPTHLYSIFSLAFDIYFNKTVIDASKVSDFYKEYFSNYNDSNELFHRYKTASSNRTHSIESRKARLQCLKEYCRS